MVAEAGSGHVAIEAQDMIWGFYPTEPAGDIDAPKLVPGEIRVQNESESADYYTVLYLDRPDLHINSRRVVINSTTGMLSSAECTLPIAHVFYLCSTSADEHRLVEVLEKIMDDPPQYHLKENNCLNLSIHALESARIIDDGLFSRYKERPLPSAFLAKLKRQAKDDSELISDYKTKQIAWVEDAYHWINV